MINTELLSLLIEAEVTEFKIHKLTDYGETITIFYIDSDDRVECTYETTTLEIANMCKRIFIHYGSGYRISSFIDFDGTWFSNISGNINEKSFQGRSEQEVVINASIWLLNLEN